MPLRLDLDGENAVVYLPFAKKKLAELKKRIAQFPHTIRNQRILANDGTELFIQAFQGGNDLIRIRAAGGVGVWYADMTPFIIEGKALPYKNGTAPPEHPDYRGRSIGRYVPLNKEDGEQKIQPVYFGAIIKDFIFSENMYRTPLPSVIYRKAKRLFELKHSVLLENLLTWYFLRRITKVGLRENSDIPAEGLPVRNMFCRPVWIFSRPIRDAEGKDTAETELMCVLDLNGSTLERRASEFAEPVRLKDALRAVGKRSTAIILTTMLIPTITDTGSWERSAVTTHPELSFDILWKISSTILSPALVLRGTRFMDSYHLSLEDNSAPIVQSAVPAWSGHKAILSTTNALRDDGTEAWTIAWDISSENFVSVGAAAGAPEVTHTHAAASLEVKAELYGAVHVETRWEFAAMNTVVVPFPVDIYAPAMQSAAIVQNPGGEVTSSTAYGRYSPKHKIYNSGDYYEYNGNVVYAGTKQMRDAAASVGLDPLYRASTGVFAFRKNNTAGQPEYLRYDGIDDGFPKVLWQTTNRVSDIVYTGGFSRADELWTLPTWVHLTEAAPVTIYAPALFTDKNGTIYDGVCAMVFDKGYEYLWLPFMSADLHTSVKSSIAAIDRTPDGVVKFASIRRFLVSISDALQREKDDANVAKGTIEGRITNKQAREFMRVDMRGRRRVVLNNFAPLELQDYAYPALVVI